MEDCYFIHEFNNRCDKGKTLAYDLNTAWQQYTLPYTRRKKLLELWRSIFRGIHLTHSPKILEYIDLSLDELPHHYRYNKSIKCKLVVGRSIGLKCEGQCNTRYLDDPNSIIPLFKLLITYGDSIVQCVSSNNKSLVREVIDTLREHNLKEYFIPDELTFNIAHQDSTHTYLRKNYSNEYLSRQYNSITFTGASDTYTCTIPGNVVLDSSAPHKDYVVVYSLKDVIPQITQHLHSLTHEIIKGTALDIIKHKLAKHILLNKI